MTGLFAALKASGVRCVLVDDELALCVDARGTRHVVAVAEVGRVDVRHAEAAGERQVRRHRVELHSWSRDAFGPELLAEHLVLLAVPLHQLQVRVVALRRFQLWQTVNTRHDIGRSACPGTIQRDRSASGGRL